MDEPEQEAVVISVWPLRHPMEEEYPGDFMSKLSQALFDAGIEWERV